MTTVPTDRTTAAIDVQDLHKYFGDNEVLKGIDFHVGNGQVVCVIGPSGSGKSTLLRCVNMLETPTSGKIFVEGEEITDPYFEATQALMTKTGSGITSLEDLAGKTIAVQDATTGADYVKENAPKDAKIVTFEDSALMEQAVKTGKADAGVNDNGLLNYFVSQNDDVEVVTEFQTGESYGFSVKKGGNDELLSVINDGIASDDYDTVYEKWFGNAPE